ncbi:hypothetical protein F4679DRAFT_583533 [Xylaria curta]|nr:hypothetical protein F4679DRAFT_583533 [Xylaria curta]
MSSRGSSTNSGYRYDSSSGSNVVQDTFRSHKSKNHQGELIERNGGGNRQPVTTINHNARGYDPYAPSPDSRHLSTYGK